MSWADLPVELLTDIFDFFTKDNRQLKNCQLVCKAWSNTAKMMLYSSVTLTNRNINSFVRNASTSGPLVKKIYWGVYCYTSDRYTWKEDSKRVIQSCPNIEYLEPYDKYLCVDIFKLINLARMVHPWKKMKGVLTESSFPYVSVNDKLLLLQYINSLEHLSYRGSDIPSTARYILQFPRIKFLDVHVDTAPADFYTVDQFLDQVPPATTNLKFYCQWIIGEGSLKHNVSAMNKTKVISHIEALETNVPIVNDSVISYFFYKFDRLSSLILNNDFGAFSLSTAVLDQIIENASKLKILEVCGMRLNNPYEILDILIKNSKVVNEVALHCEDDFDPYGEDIVIADSDPYTCISIKNNTGIKTDSLQMVITISESRDTDVRDNLQPYIHLLLRYGSYLQTLTLHNFPNRITVNLETGTTDNESTYLINNVLQYCPFVKTLSLDSELFADLGGKYAYPEQLDLVQNNSIETLIVGKHCSGYSSTFSYMSQRLPSLSKLVASLKDIVNYFPSLNYTTKCFENDIDMAYNQLDTIQLDLERLSVKQNKLCFIKLVTDEGTRYYYYLEKLTLGDGRLLNECSEDDFKEYLNKDVYIGVRYFVLRCKFIRKVILNSETHHRTLVF